jgi:outer membrane protein insertion porin family
MKGQYRAEFFQPLNSVENWVLGAGGRIGYADSLGGNSFPFFKNYYAGGLKTVRGYKNNSLGPRDSNDDPFGGNVLAVGSMELIFPTPFISDQSGWRTLAFLDAGNVYSTDCLSGSANCSEGIDLGDIRYSVGVGLSWLTPVGPLSVALAVPLNDQGEDDTEFFQFALGQTF